ncbi:MAG: TIGR01777 family oxidoreductase [Pseudomonadota bacterium]
MRILMTGATGLIGRELGKALAARGDSLVCLVRDVPAARRRLPFPAILHPWDHTRPVPAHALEGVEAVVNLAGEPVADKRWTSAQKQLIRDSRVLGTQQLVGAVLEHGHGVAAFVQGSAIGYYGERGDDQLTASSAKGRGFAADFVQLWEAALEPLTTQRPRVRVPIIRTGVVLAREGGALAKMLPMFRLSMAGQLSSGRQWMSWIHLQDIVGLLVHALDKAPSGILEGVAPHPATNRQFTKALCQSLDVMQNLPLPRPAISVLFGERASIVIGSTRVQPHATLASGFAFRFETVEQALEDLLAPLRGAVHLRVWEQWIACTGEDLWPFFCDANKLEAMTPAFLAARVQGMSTPVIGKGTLIDYQLRLHGIPVKWQARIEDWDRPRRFVDVQVKGPFALWHHTHDFIPMGGGTLMRNTVRYRLPGKWPGAVAGSARVAGDLDRIFGHRSQIIEERFGLP